MKLKEAMKLATPGPLTACAPIDLNHGGLDVAYTRCLITDDAVMKEKTVLRQPAGCRAGYRQVNAAVLAHWYNNGPKLLEALKRISDNEELAASRKGGCEDNAAIVFTGVGVRMLNELIAECEEVKGV